MIFSAFQIKTISKTEFIVLSGGVASNGYIRNALEKVATFYGHSLIVPPLHLCCDNAEMIAWNGIKLLQEKYILDYCPLDVNYCQRNRWNISSITWHYERLASIPHFGPVASLFL